MVTKPRKIEGLRWEETSGVDHPANEEEGWLVMKSADSDEGTETVTDELLDQMIANEVDDPEEKRDAKGIGNLVGRVIERLFSRGVHDRKPKKYSEKDIAVAINENATEFITDLVAIMNEKTLSKDEISQRVIEAVKALQAAVEEDLNKEDE